jgi:hypothetical protein
MKRKLTRHERIVLASRQAEPKKTEVPTKVRPSTKSRRGGARPGAGAPLRDERAGVRKMASFRLHADTHKRLHLLVESGVVDSQAVAIDQAIERMANGAGLKP